MRTGIFIQLNSKTYDIGYYKHSNKLLEEFKEEVKICFNKHYKRLSFSIQESNMRFWFVATGEIYKTTIRR